MSVYLTKQRKALLEYLAANHDELLSAEQIAEALKDSGISRSAVYRNLATLEADGKLRRCGKAGDRTVYYQFSDAEECREKLHISCRECGKTVHVDRDIAEKLEKRIAEDEGFLLDRSETVLYGVCRDCAKKK